MYYVWFNFKILYFFQVSSVTTVQRTSGSRKPFDQGEGRILEILHFNWSRRIVVVTVCLQVLLLLLFVNVRNMHGLYEHQLTLSLIYFLKPLRSPLCKQQPLLERLLMKVSIFLHFFSYFSVSYFFLSITLHNIARLKISLSSTSRWLMIYRTV